MAVKCDSKKHISALHPSPPSTETDSREGEKGDGGEVREKACTPVASKHTEICGNAQIQCSCSKISAVILYPASKKKRSKENVCSAR